MLDDQTEVDARLLTAYWHAMTTHPWAQVFAGRVEPRLAERPPRWLRSAWEPLRHLYGGYDLGPAGLDLRTVAANLPAASNYLIRADLLQRFVAGLQPAQTLAGVAGSDDRRMLAHLLAAGVRGRWVPEAGVTRWIPSHQHTREFVRRRALESTLQALPLNRSAGPAAATALRRRVRKAALRSRLCRALPPTAWADALLRQARWQARLMLAEGIEHASDPLAALWRHANAAAGLIDTRAGAVLYTLARWFAPPGAVVELGSWMGRSTVWLAGAARDRGTGKVYAVDTWDGGPELARRVAGKDADWLYRVFSKNLADAGLAGQVEPWRLTTLEAARQWSAGPIGLLFVDAGHEYPVVRADFDAWAPHVAPGGYIVFDDVPYWPGPTRVVAELPMQYEWVTAPPNQWVVRKRHPDA